MSKRKLNTEQIIGVLKQLEAGRTAAEMAREIRAAVDALREEYREVFVLFHEQGQAYEEIAEAVGRPVGTVKTWLHRARLEILDRLRSRGLVSEEQVPKTPLVQGE